MTKKVLVTGALGFLGSHIARKFASESRRVIGTHRRPISPSDVHELGLADFSTLEFPSDGFDTLLKRAEPNLLVHCAGPASVVGSVAEPYNDFRYTVDVLFGVLDSLRRQLPTCRVILISSAAVYGNPQVLPIREDAQLSPISPYGFHKLMCETLINEFVTVYGLRACSVRIFSAYGRGLQRQVLWDICRKAMEEGVVRLQGTGDETRDFIHAEDIAHAIALIAERSAFAGEAYNLASGTATRIRDLSSTLVNALNVEAPIEFSGSIRAGDPSFWQADMSRMSGLGFRPTHTLKQGVEDFARWVLHLNDAGASKRS